MASSKQEIEKLTDAQLKEAVLLYAAIRLGIYATPKDVLVYDDTDYDSYQSNKVFAADITYEAN